jgi:hypothetical protein
MSSKIKLIPVIAGGRIMCKVVSEIDQNDGVRIENAVENTRCAVEALLYREGVYNDGSITLPDAKSSVVVRFTNKCNRYTCYVSSDHSPRDCKAVTDFNQSIFELVRELLAEVQNQSEVKNG